MAIQAATEKNGIAIPAAYIRVQYIWGDKDQGWHAKAIVYSDKTKIAEVTRFDISAPFVEGQDAYTALYAALDAQLAAQNPAQYTGLVSC